MSVVGTFEPIVQHLANLPFNHSLLTPRTASRTTVWHDGYQVFYLNGGHLNLKIAGQIARYSTGQYVIIKLATDYQVLNYSGRVLSLAFPRVCQPAAVQVDRATLQKLAGYDLRSLLYQVAVIANRTEPAAIARLRALGVAITQRLQQLGDRKPDAAAAAIERSLFYLQTHSAERLTTNRLARVAGLPVARFVTAFDRTTKKTPGAVLHEIRLAKAKCILASASVQPSIVTVVRQTGYPNVGELNRDFKQTEGLTASQWWLKHQGSNW